MIINGIDQENFYEHIGDTLEDIWNQIEMRDAAIRMKAKRAREVLARGSKDAKSDESETLSSADLRKKPKRSKPKSVKIMVKKTKTARK